MARASNPLNEFTPNSQGTIAKLVVRESLVVPDGFFPSNIPAPPNSVTFMEDFVNGAQLLMSVQSANVYAEVVSLPNNLDPTFKVGALNMFINTGLPPGVAMQTSLDWSGIVGAGVAPVDVVPFQIFGCDAVRTIRAKVVSGVARDIDFWIGGDWGFRLRPVSVSPNWYLWTGGGGYDTGVPADDQPHTFQIRFTGADGRQRAFIDGVQCLEIFPGNAQFQRFYRMETLDPGADSECSMAVDYDLLTVSGLDRD